MFQWADGSPRGSRRLRHRRWRWSAPRLEDAVYTYHEFLAAEGIAVYHTDCEEEFAPIPGDPDRLRQVFCNLLDNAAKHGGAGKRIDTAIYPDDGDVVITVRDYGPGIPPDELPNV